MGKELGATGLFILLALVFGVMAVGTSTAHAELNAAWKVKGAAVTEELKAQIQVTELETLASTGVKEGILLTKTGLTKVEILCTAMKFVDALLKVLGVILGKVHFEGCVTKLNGGAAAAACKPHSPGAAEGLIETELLKALIKLHEPKAGEKVDQLEVTPDEGANFVLLKFGKEVGSECSIASDWTLTGKFFAKAGTVGEGLEEKTEHLFQEGALSALLFGGNAMTIDGSAKAALVTPHLGMTWSGVAN